MIYSETNPDVHDSICVKVAEESRTVPWRRIFILSWINLMSKRYQNSIKIVFSLVTSPSRRGWRARLGVHGVPASPFFSCEGTGPDHFTGK